MGKMIVPELRGAAFIGLVCCSLFACRSRRTLTPPPGCKTPEVLTCLSKYAFDQLDESALQDLLKEGLNECFARDPRLLQEQSSCLPIELGKDEKTGHSVRATYLCSDRCPDHGGIILKLHAALHFARLAIPPQSA